MRCVGFQTMLIRGCEWAATGEVTHPVPHDFPLANEVKLGAEPVFCIKTKKPEDRVTAKTEQDSTILDVTSPSGIGGATITLEKGRWPTTTVLRLHLGGLESLAITSGKTRLMGSVVSHSGTTKRVFLIEDGKDGERAADTEIKALDATGRPIQGLPEKGGYFEITLPKALLENQPSNIEVSWIDFYR